MLAKIIYIFFCFMQITDLTLQQKLSEQPQKQAIQMTRMLAPTQEGSVLQFARVKIVGCGIYYT